MNIRGIEGLTVKSLQTEISRGGKFVIYQYCFSILIMTFRRSSDIYFIKAQTNTFGTSWGYILLTLLLGWWGIPWGPIYSLEAIFTNIGGGKNVTKEVMTSFNIPNVTKKPAVAPIENLEKENNILELITEKEKSEKKILDSNDISNLENQDFFNNYPK